MRPPNAVDFWRGYALLSIYFDHLPENYLRNFTLINLAVCSAAELFVFLAGWALSLATGGPRRPDPPSRCLLRAGTRACQIYVVQIAISAIALAMLAVAMLVFVHPKFSQMINAGLFFADPITTTPGFVALTYQLNYFDILPLYVVLLLFAAPLAVVARRRLGLAVIISFAIYVISLVFSLNLPLWPQDGHWRFNPLCWQFIFILGFASSELNAEGKLERWLPTLRLVAIPLVGIGLIFALTGLGNENSRLLWDNAFSSTEQGPPRLLNFVAVAVVFGILYRPIYVLAPRLTELMCSLGRNSLAVFAVGSLLVVVVRVLDVRFGRPGLFAVAFSGFGVAISLLTARIAEWRSLNASDRSEAAHGERATFAEPIEAVTPKSPISG